MLKSGSMPLHYLWMKSGVLFSIAGGLAVAIVLAVVFSACANDASSESPSKQKYGLYLYLFKLNPALKDEAILAYSQPLYEKASQATGIARPTFEQIHYTISKEGVYNYTNTRIESYGPVKIIVSDSIIKSDGSPLKEEDISQKARFYFAPMAPAPLIEEKDGEIYAWSQDHYDKPNNVGEAGIIRTIMLPVEASDFEKVNSRYQQIRDLVEPFETNQ
jgi:hypothetical protein